MNNAEARLEGGGVRRRRRKGRGCREEKWNGCREGIRDVDISKEEISEMSLGL